MHLFTELVGIQMLLMNSLEPLLRGEKMTQEQLTVLYRRVQTTKPRRPRTPSEAESDQAEMTMATAQQWERRESISGRRLASFSLAVLIFHRRFTSHRDPFALSFTSVNARQKQRRYPPDQMDNNVSISAPASRKALDERG